MSLGYYENLEIQAPGAWDQTNPSAPQKKSGNTAQNALHAPLKSALAVAYRSVPRIVFGATDLPSDGTSIKIVDRLKGRKFVIIDVPQFPATIVPFSAGINNSSSVIVPASLAGINVGVITITGAAAVSVVIKGTTSGIAYASVNLLATGSTFDVGPFPGVTEGFTAQGVGAGAVTVSGFYSVNPAGIYLQQRNETIVNESGATPQIQTLPAAFYLPVTDPPLEIDTEASIWACTAVIGMGATIQYCVGIGEESMDT